MEVVGGCEPLADDPPEIPPSIVVAPALPDDVVTAAPPLVLPAALVPPTPLAPLPLVLSGTLPDLEVRRLRQNDQQENEEGKKEKNQ